MSDTHNGKGPVISVRAFLENKDGDVLITKRADTENDPGHWSFLGGIIGYLESPEQGLERLVKQKTNLDISDLDFLSHQNSPPLEPGHMHCLNVYFKAKARGNILLADGFTEYKWVNPKQLHEYKLAFMGNDAIKFYEFSKQNIEKQLWELVDEAGRMSIPVTRKRLIELQAQPGYFQQLKTDIEIYDQVRVKVNATLQMIRGNHKRGSEPVITQIQSRTKTPESVMEKSVRKGSPNTPRHYTTFDDMSGARAIVSFLKDIYTVREALLSFPEYKVREVLDYIKNPLNSGYRALHVTLEVPLPGINFVPRCEVQIKTVGMHSWSNATHELTYKNSRIPQGHLDEFRNLSNTLWDAEMQIDKLRHEIEHMDDHLYAL